MKKTITLAAFLLSVCFAALGAQVLPAEPVEFQTVHLRLETDSCMFVPSTVRVSSAANVIRITQQPNNCLLPGEQRLVDIRLGAFPVGDYGVEVYASPQPVGTPLTRLDFRVTRGPEIAIFPPPTRPLADHTGVWWTPGESGWGLFLYQSPVMHMMFGAWFVYGADGRPEWFTLQEGRWTSYATWTATVYRTSGPYLGNVPFDPRRVTITPVGTASVDFTQSPGIEGRAVFRYEIDGIGSGTRTLQRLFL